MRTADTQWYQYLLAGAVLDNAIIVFTLSRCLVESKGKEATPSGWKPGKATLKPGPDLVGKVWEVWKTEMAFD